MGVNLSALIEGHKIEVEGLKDGEIAIDAYDSLYYVILTLLSKLFEVPSKNLT